MEKIYYSLLRLPFRESDIEWRISRAGEKNGKPWATVLAYVTNRAIQDRLDSVCTPFGWKNEFRDIPGGGVECCIYIKNDGEWIGKWDAADNTNIEATKGGRSGAMKRAGSQWGIGRYLYNLTENFAIISENGKHYQPGKQGKYPSFKWDPPKLPAWALPNYGEENVKKMQDILEKAKAFYIKREDSTKVSFIVDMIESGDYKHFNRVADTYKIDAAKKVLTEEKPLEPEQEQSGSLELY
jgi:hypothetical protein